MPIPGPSTGGDDWAVAATGSPFWLRIAGTWVHLEGVDVEVAVGTERPGSTFTALGGRRYEQRAPLARRSWTVGFSWASSAGIAALAAAVELEDVWLASDAVLSSNMLPPRSCFGTGVPVDCGGMPLPGFTAGAVVGGQVRGAVPTTLALWTDGALSPAASVTFPGGTTSVTASAAGQSSVTFAPDADGPVTVEIPDEGVSGLTLTEGSEAPEVWVPGESMPCRVVVDDPADTLRLCLQGVWRHDYAVTIREVD